MMNEDLETLATNRAIALILSRYGSLSDLPEEFVQVIWVTIYRACEIGVKMETDGGEIAIAKSMLLGDGHDAMELEQRIQQVKFLQEFVPIIRSANTAERGGDIQLAIDVLKWNIVSAADMSRTRRMIVRTLAKADSMYDQPIPKELMQ